MQHLGSNFTLYFFNRLGLDLQIISPTVTSWEMACRKGEGEQESFIPPTWSQDWVSTEWHFKSLCTQLLILILNIHTLSQIVWVTGIVIDTFISTKHCYSKLCLPQSTYTLWTMSKRWQLHIRQSRSCICNLATCLFQVPKPPCSSVTLPAILGCHFPVPTL